VTVAAAESNEGGRALSRQMSATVVRILLFYVLSIFLILCIVPWREIHPGDSPFALALGRLGLPAAATVMNLIVLTAVLSCLNSGVYVSARVLFSLAAHADAPKALVAVSARQVPSRAILLSSAFGYGAVIASVLSPQRLFAFLVNASGAIMLVIYLLVCFAYLQRGRSRGHSWREFCNQGLAVGTVIAIVTVMVSMVFINGLSTQLYASLACVACAVAAQRIVRRRVGHDRTFGSAGAAPHIADDSF